MEYEPVPIISNQFPDCAIRLIESAVHSIDIVVFDWRFYKNDPANPVSLFNSAIARACQRGVNVRCLVQSESALENLKALGCYARVLHTKKLLHAKMILVDKDRIIIGSHNYTQSAFTSNLEASIFVKLADKKNAFVEYFNNLFGL